ncbi:hypothetical protein [Micromonospora parathelypteridis]|uniref:Uncharacterized protein n=1 Tax=Micromonospora parathelypteridis TaxID=1839617 RepID=A0A840VTK2_9ACTN|nr:hypothetical protein [Micromonospora parathelypteridis]MBB5476348.1 hypothetical protein [Micromonospora parathelypteridis]GGO14693.1 hypothetical protein GCM10011576_25970 [Micromonospora parathelypteridis]
MTAAVFSSVPLPTTRPARGERIAAGAGLATPDRARLVERITSWVDSPAMTALLAEFGAEQRLAGSLAERLRALEEFSATRWDYRKGQVERYEAVGETFTAPTDVRIRSAARSLGLAARVVPRNRRFDHVLVLGGGVRTMMARAHLAATILRQGVQATSVDGLGSLRPIPEQNVFAAQFGLGDVATEGDAVDETLRHVFSAAPATEQRSGTTETGHAWWVRSHGDVEPPVHVLAAPSSRPGKRANTADTLIGWAELLRPAPVGVRLLLVTTDIFVPFQHCEAVRLLGLRFGCDVETVGFDSSVNPWVPPAPTFAILQEVRSTIRSMQALYEALG